MLKIWLMIGMLCMMIGCRGLPLDIYNRPIQMEIKEQKEETIREGLFKQEEVLNMFKTKEERCIIKAFVMEGASFYRVTGDLKASKAKNLEEFLTFYSSDYLLPNVFKEKLRNNYNLLMKMEVVEGE